MKLVAVALLLLQFVQRAPLTPAETLLEPEVLLAIRGQAPVPTVSVHTAGTEPGRHVLLTCVEGQCGTAARAARIINALVEGNKLPRPTRTIRVLSAADPSSERALAAIHLAEIAERPFQIIRSPWSHPGVGDEVVEIFAQQNGMAAQARAFERVGQLELEPLGVPTTTIVTGPSESNDHAAFVAAASAYFLATLPNAGAEALLSHLTVGAHARLAEDGRRAVAHMGNQQRASADVLIMFGQAIEREQRRMRSFERFMPSPVDPMLHSRILDMEKGITGVWTSIGITSSPFVPAAERIRGRGGDDRRVPTRAGTGLLPRPEPPTAFLKLPNVDVVIYELGNFIDGKRTISDIRDAVSAEFTPISLPVVSDYFDRLAKTGAITIR